MRGSQPRGHRTDDGATMVEASLLLPVVALILFGMVQYSLLIGATIVLNNAAMIAARTAAFISTNPADVTAAAAAALSPMLDSTRLVQPVVPTTVTLSSGGTATRVDLLYNMPLLLRFVVPWAGGSTLQLRASMTMR